MDTKPTSPTGNPEMPSSAMPSNTASTQAGFCRTSGIGQPTRPLPNASNPAPLHSGKTGSGGKPTNGASSPGQNVVPLPRQPGFVPALPQPLQTALNRANEALTPINPKL